jgi:hypothetical protein
VFTKLQCVYRTVSRDSALCMGGARGAGGAPGRVSRAATGQPAAARAAPAAGAHTDHMRTSAGAACYRDVRGCVSRTSSEKGADGERLVHVSLSTPLSLSKFVTRVLLAERRGSSRRAGPPSPQALPPRATVTASPSSQPQHAFLHHRQLAQDVCHLRRRQPSRLLPERVGRPSPWVDLGAHCRDLALRRTRPRRTGPHHVPF